MKHLDAVLHASPHGGSRLGWSMISKFRECEMRWFISQAIPHPKGGHGVASRGTSRPLWVGSRVHVALETWIRSGNDPDATMAALEADIREHLDEAWEPVEGAKWAAQATDVVLRYTRDCGVEGPDPDGDRFVVARDEHGEPWVEREFEIDLGWEGYYYTTKIDALAWDVVSLRGQEAPVLRTDSSVEWLSVKWLSVGAGMAALTIVEHKTIDVTRLASALRGYALDPQLSGEALAVRSVWPQLPTVIPVVNGIKKAARGKPQGLTRTWEPMHRTPTDLAKFRIDVVRRVQQMDQRMGEFVELVAGGTGVWEAADLTFDGSPKGITCADQGRTCPFYDACFRRSHRAQWLETTEPRFPAEETP